MIRELLSQISGSLFDPSLIPGYLDAIPNNILNQKRHGATFRSYRAKSKGDLRIFSDRTYRAMPAGNWVRTLHKR